MILLAILLFGAGMGIGTTLGTSVHLDRLEQCYERQSVTRMPNAGQGDACMVSAPAGFTPQSTDL
jgi:hypothetical protein